MLLRLLLRLLRLYRPNLSLLGITRADIGIVLGVISSLLLLLLLILARLSVRILLIVAGISAVILSWRRLRGSTGHC